MVSAPLRLVLLGATGFTGSAIIRRGAALAPGALSVRALVRDLARAPRERFVVPVAGELPGALPASLFPDEPHVVIHLGTKQIDGDGSGFSRVNVEGTERLLDALPASCAGVIYGSSTSVYGQGANRGEDEDAAVRPETPLARSRAAAEAAILAWAEGARRSASALRPRFVIGRGDRYTLPGLARMLERGLRVGPGTQAFTVIDVDDYAEVVLALARRILARADGGCPRRTALHVGYRRPVALDEILDALGRALGLEPPRRTVPAPRLLAAALGALPLGPTRALATRLELIGVSHHVSVERLAAEIGPEIVSRDAAAALARAAQELASRGGVT